MYSIATFCVLCYLVYAVGIHCTTPTLRNGKVSYEGAQLWRTVFRSTGDAQLIQRLYDNQKISLWSLSQDSADFLVPEDTKMNVYRHLNSRRLNHSVIIMDVQRRIDAQKVGQPHWNDDTLRIGHRLNWVTYPTLKIIDEYYNFLTENYPSICKVQSIGQSVEHRPIKMVTISNGNPENKRIVIISGVHAREWIGITSALYIINEIVTKFDSQPSYVKNKDWSIIPLLNPDGFEYTHSHDRLWRKNRQKFNDCYGVDINRNFGTYWTISEIIEINACKNTYAGPRPFSEPEARALRGYIQKLSTKPVALVDLHAYGQKILYPWAAISQPSPHEALLNSTAKGMSEAIFNATKEIYTFGNCFHKIYPASGTIVDWIYSAGIHQVFAIETRNKGVHGFLLPSKEIEETGIELFAAIKYLTKVTDTNLFKRRRNCHEWF